MMLGYLLILLGCALLTFGVVYFGQRAFPQTPNVVEDLIYRTLPQTQCAQCGYPGCRPYAAAVAKGEAINRCPPGGEALIQTLASLLNRPASPLASELKAVPVPLIARIQESNCIGCMLCIKACPVDAIIGSQNLMHSVIESECTGCELCLPPCPVDCIDLIEADSPQAVTSMRPKSDEACIFCSACVTACPKSLTPQHLFLAFDQPERSEKLGLSDCIECTLCDQVCPSELPLTESFRRMKDNQRLITQAAETAEATEQRFLRRETRIQTAAATLKMRPKPKDALALIAQIKDSSGS